MSVLLTRTGMCVVAMVLVVAALGPAARAAEQEVPLRFAGGHVIGEGDFGRPINLMAAGLGVKPEQFREAFSGVTPAKGRPPTREEERRNKAALMKVLKPLGVTNERMDEVANYYRFRPQEGETWPTAPAKGYAVVEDGRVKRVVVTEAGSGYNTPPEVTVAGVEGVRLKAKVWFGRELKRNGGVAGVEVVGEEGK